MRSQPIDPKPAASVELSWKRIDGWLTQHAPMLMEKMGKGATPEAIAKTEVALGLELPDDVRASYSIHDGSGGWHLFPSGEYLSLEEMVREYENWMGLVEELGFDEAEGDPKGPIRKVHYHRNWIPLMSNGAGDHTLIDLAPKRGGTVGQLIDFSHETGPEQVAARSMTVYLKRFAEALTEVGIEPSGSGQLYWYWEQGMARSGFPTVSQQADLQARERAMKSSKRYFERSNHFWEVTHDEAKVTSRYGKIGTGGLSKTRICDNTGTAYIETSKAVLKKVKQGYVEKK